MNKTKILATLGPASDSAKVIRALIDVGVDAFRFNFSHGAHDEHRARVETARACAAERGRQVALLQDLQGPKIRIDLEGRDPVTMEDDAAVLLTAEANRADALRVAYPPLCSDVKPGEPILVDDGKIVLEVTAVEAPVVTCRVRVGGLVYDRKGVNLPGTRTSLPPLTEKDRADLAAGLAMDFDYVALSFVQSADDIRLLRAEMDRIGKQRPIVAKLERPAAIENLDEILDATDAVMVARGALGIEIPIERVPVVQKRVIAAANRKGIPVITATQMLESMTATTTPTRAEVTDVANALYDGTDVVMLSGETSIGRFPVEAARKMDEIIREAESFPVAYTQGFRAFSSASADEDGTTAHLAAQASRDMDLKAICVYTQSGRTAVLVSKFRPEVDVYAFCPNAEVVNRLGLLWGIVPVPFALFEHSEDLLKAINDHVSANGIARAGDRIAVAFGAPIPAQNPGNTLRLHEVG